MRHILLPTIVFLILIALFLKDPHLLTNKNKTQNPVELAVAKEHDGTDRFLEQVKRSRGEWIENAGPSIFDNKFIATLATKPAENTSTAVLGSHIAADGSEKWIEVDISDQKLYAWEGNRKAYEFSVSTGRPGYDTVQGEFRVWRKVRNQTYRGGSEERGDYYYLPNVPHSLFFYQGYAIHGAYWHNDFGIKRRSSGCVNVRPDEAEQVYNWAGPAMPAGAGALNSTNDNPGIKVVVHG